LRSIATDVTSVRTSPPSKAGAPSFSGTLDWDNGLYEHMFV
jgi:hypothetical protein